MFGKRIHKVTYEDLVKLLDSKELHEGYRLDFKRELGRKNKEIAKDVSSFANTNGGYLIYGIDDDDDQTIIGIDSIVNNRNIAEWFNQVISGNVMPDIFYKEPHCIKIPDTDKVVMIIEIPESSRKPHMLTEDHRYYIRVNDSSRAAKHHEVRDMFSYSRDRKSDFESYFKYRNLDTDNENFALTYLSNKIERQPTNNDLKNRPLILFSVLPKYINEEMFLGSSAEQLHWFNKHSTVEIGNESLEIHGHYSDMKGKIDGYISEHLDRNQEFCSYFEVLTNGFVEAGFSRSFANVSTRTQKQCWTLDVDLIIGYYIGLLKWIRKFYTHCEYRDEFLIQISMTDILDAKLLGFKKEVRPSYMYDDLRNKYDNKLSIAKRVYPTNCLIFIRYEVI